MGQASSLESKHARQAAVTIIGALRQAGHVAYLAGGCVRDELLGREPKDYDVATDARPETVKSLFKGSRFVGEAFGVVLVRMRGVAVEVATFRREWGYTDGRRPTQVQFTDAQEDAQRRDFTINGLFEDPLVEGTAAAPLSVAEPGRGKIIDFVGGLDDLRARVIRAIGDPEARFSEDYLRLLRAVRFASVLGFALEPRIAAAITAQAPNLSRISRERIGQEMRRMFDPSTGGGADAAQAAQMIQDLQLDGPILHEDHAQPALPTLHRLMVSPWRAETTLPAALAAWALDRQLPGVFSPAAPGAAPALDLPAAVEHWLATGFAPLLRRWRKALCLSNEDRDALADILAGLVSAVTWPTLTRSGRKRLLADVHWRQVRALLGALGHHPTAIALLEQIDQQSGELLAEGVAPPPLLTGEDLIALGLRPGPIFGRLLDQAYDLQLEGKLADRDQALSWLRRQENFKFQV